MWTARERLAASSTRLLTGSADTNAKLWDVETGKELFNFPHKVRPVTWFTSRPIWLDGERPLTLSLPLYHTHARRRCGPAASTLATT